MSRLRLRHWFHLEVGEHFWGDLMGALALVLFFALAVPIVDYIVRATFQLFAR